MSYNNFIRYNKPECSKFFKQFSTNTQAGFFSGEFKLDSSVTNITSNIDFLDFTSNHLYYINNKEFNSYSFEKETLETKKAQNINLINTELVACSNKLLMIDKQNLYIFNILNMTSTYHHELYGIFNYFSLRDKIFFIKEEKHKAFLYRIDLNPFIIKKVVKFEKRPLAIKYLDRRNILIIYNKSVELYSFISKKSVILFSSQKIFNAVDVSSCYRYFFIATGDEILVFDVCLCKTSMLLANKSIIGINTILKLKYLSDSKKLVVVALQRLGDKNASLYISQCGEHKKKNRLITSDFCDVQVYCQS